MESLSVWPIVFVIVLVLFSGLFSGLTLGLLGLDLYGLEIAMASDTIEAKYAADILPIRKKGNMLLCTLLLGNVAVNAAVSVVLTQISDGLWAFIISTVLIVLCGEIIPQAICSRHALFIGSKMTLMVRFLMMLMFPVTWPVSKVLDWALGEELGTIYDKKGLSKLVQIHRQQEGANLNLEEANIMSGALIFADKKVTEIMTPLSKCFMLDVNQKLDFDLLAEIFQSGFSRIPIYDKSLDHVSICGLLFVKDLILLDPDDAVPVKTLLNFYGHEVSRVFADSSLRDVFCDFKSGRSHLAIVVDVCSDCPCDPYYLTRGLVTLEDIVEVILQDNIVDETDVYIDMQRQNPVYRPQIGRSMLSHFNPQLQRADLLSGPELDAVFFHLRGTCRPFAALSDSSLRLLLSSSRVVRSEVPEQPNLGKFSPEADRISSEIAERLLVPVEDGGLELYRMNRASTWFTLVLDGRVCVRSGRRGFETFVGRWCTLGEEVFDDENDGDAFVPDFTAELVRTSRLLRIEHAAFVRLRDKQDSPPRIMQPMETEASSLSRRSNEEAAAHHT